MKLPEIAINRPVTIFMLCLILLLLGGISFWRLPVDLMPDIEYPTLTVITAYEGVAPEEMETLVTRPIEESLGSTPQVKEISATSSEGQSQVRINFEWGTNLDEAANEVRTRLDRVRGALPEDADAPTLYKFDVSQFPILYLAISGDRSPGELRQFVEDQIQYRIERIPGVAAADIRGGLKREIHVDLDLEKLQAYDLSVGSVVNVLRRENQNEPVGPIPEGDYEVLLRSRGEFQAIQPMRKLVVSTKGSVPVYLEDIATVEDSFEEVRQSVRVNGKPGLRLSIRKQSGANTVKVAQDVKAELERINRDFPDLTIWPIIDSSKFIEQSIDNVRSAAISGAILAVLVLFLFLRSLRSTLIIALSIPIAVIATFALMYFNDFTLNTMSFGGLALGIGMLVDNAIVVLENIFRHLEEGTPKLEAAVVGSGEVSTAIVASTLTTLAVFVPLVFLTGISGIMFQQLSYVIAFALLCSLAVALTVIPILCSRYLAVRKRDDQHHPALGKLVRASGRFLDHLDGSYQELIHWALAHRRTVIVGSAAVLTASLLLVPFIGFEMMPATDEGEVRISVEMPPGTRFEATDAVVRELEEVVRREVPEAANVLSEVGGSGWRNSSTHRADLRVSLVERAKRSRSSEQIAQALRPHLVRRPGMIAFARSGGGLFLLRLGQSDSDRVSVEIRGHDMQVAADLANTVKGIVENVPGVTDAQISRRPGVPEIRIVVDREKAATMGLNISDISDALRTTIGGRVATQFRQAGNEYDVLVRLREADRQQMAAVDRIPIHAPTGQTVPASNLIQMRRGEGPVNIQRKDQERIITVSANIADRDLGSIVGDIQQRLRSLRLPPDFAIVHGGEYEQQQEAFNQLILCLVLAIILVYAVMASQFESLRDPLIILFSIPMAAVGIILMLFLTNTTFNIQAFIGTIMLAGIVVNNAIVLTDYVNLLRRRDGLALRQAVELGGRRRLRPILMTTLTTVLAMVPMALGIGEGGEVQAPMARVVIAGLLTSTLITLIFIPTLYACVEEWGTRRQEEEEPERDLGAWPEAGQPVKPTA
ncbi:MAG: efflux RND transporter permease subunit [Acidobacteriota bacterium]